MPHGASDICTNCRATLNGSPHCASCGIDQADDPYIGRLLGGRYEICELLGIGGMGRVYRAVHVGLERLVAVKLINPKNLENPTAAARFMVEARAASRLNHPNVIAIHDFGGGTAAEGPELYLVMELLSGPSLGEVLRAGPMPMPRVMDVLCQILGALHEAHQQGVTHRDIKPENIILEPLRPGVDQVKVIDFGVAKLQSGTNVTRTGEIIGTPRYMSPEQARGGSAGPAADIYAVGVLMFEMLTGHRAFEGRVAYELIAAILSEDRPDPRVTAPERAIPAALAEVCCRAMALDPAERYAGAEAMARAILEAAGRRWLPKHSLLFVSRTPAAVTALRPPPRPPESDDDTTTPSMRRRDQTPMPSSATPMPGSLRAPPSLRTPSATPEPASMRGPSSGPVPGSMRGPLLAPPPASMRSNWTLEPSSMRGSSLTPEPSSMRGSGMTPPPNSVRGSGVTPPPNAVRGSGMTPPPNAVRGSGMTPPPNSVRGPGMMPPPNSVRGSGMMPPPNSMRGSGMTSSPKSVRGSGMTSSPKSVRGASLTATPNSAWGPSLTPQPNSVRGSSMTAAPNSMRRSGVTPDSTEGPVSTATPDSMEGPVSTATPDSMRGPVSTATPDSMRALIFTPEPSATSSAKTIPAPRPPGDRPTLRMPRAGTRSDDEGEAIRLLVEAFQAARNEVLAGELEAGASWAPVGRQLGGALVGAGRVDEAYGVLSEILEHTDPRTMEHALVTEQLAHVAERRGRLDEMRVLLQKALDIAESLGDEAAAARLRLSADAHGSGVRPSTRELELPVLGDSIGDGRGTG